MATERVDSVPGSARAHDFLVRACEELFQTLGFPVAVVNQRPVLTTKGWRTPGASTGFSDLVACAGGRMILVECKTGGARLSREQSENHAKWSRAGALCLTVYSVGELLRALRAEGLAR